MAMDVTKSPSRIAGMFDAIAGRYDLLNHLLSGNLDKGWRRRAIAALKLTGQERVLDLCTGTGDLAIAAMAATPSAAHVTGVDFAGAMLTVGRGKILARRLHDRVAFVRGDATRIPVAERSVNAITIGFGIRNVEDVPAACREMYRVLAPNGRLAILEFANPSTPGFRSIYRWYSTRVLPRVGRLISGHSAAYAYLPASIDAFATPAELVGLLREAGFRDVTASPMTCGTVYLYVGTK